MMDLQSVTADEASCGRVPTAWREYLGSIWKAYTGEGYASTAIHSLLQLV